MVASADFTLAVATEPANASLMQIDDRIVSMVIMIIIIATVMKMSKEKC